MYFISQLVSSFVVPLRDKMKTKGDAREDVSVIINNGDSYSNFQFQ
jgi:hypothetical protein